MSPQTGAILANVIWPILKVAVPRTVTPAPGEDVEEIVADALASAANMAESVERSGRIPIGKSVAFYAIQRAKVGRRSGYAGQMDAMSARARLGGNVSMVDLDQEIGDSGDEGSSLHEVIDSNSEDPAQLVARKMDREELMGTLSQRERDIVDGLASGKPLNILANKYGISAARICQATRLLAQKIRTHWGACALADALTSPSWKRGDLRAIRETAACRHERALASAL